MPQVYRLSAQYAPGYENRPYGYQQEAELPGIDIVDSPGYLEENSEPRGPSLVPVKRQPQSGHVQAPQDQRQQR